MTVDPSHPGPAIRRTHLRRLTGAILAFGLLIAPSAQAFGTRDIAASLEIVFTTSGDRSSAAPANGVGITPDGEFAVFLESNLPIRDSFFIKYVRFYLNGHRINKETRPPYDLGGTRDLESATLIDRDLLRTGENKIKARVKLRNGKKFNLYGTLNVLPTEPSIVDIATGDENFSLLVEALLAAGLLPAVDGTDPITVFAPTNAAFVALLDELGLTKEELFANTELLTSVLTYHVVPGALFSPAVLAAETLTPLQGEPIFVDPSVPAVNDSVLGPIDIAASNGVVHVIDKVLLPESITNPQQTIAELAAADGRFGILLAAVTEVGLDGLLSVNGPDVTVFAPTDEAFTALLDALRISAGELLANKPLLTTVLLYHLVNAELFAEDVLAASEIFPMESEPITVNAEAGQLNDVAIAETDLDASNGVIHVLNGVLVPPAALELLSAE